MGPCRDFQPSSLKNCHVPLMIINDDTLSFQLPAIPVPTPPKASCEKCGVESKRWVCKPPKLASTYKISSAIRYSSCELPDVGCVRCRGELTNWRQKALRSS